jgi:hypothetical protein
MDASDLLILLSVFVVGIMVGYGIREVISKRRRLKYRRRSDTPESIHYLSREGD